VHQGAARRCVEAGEVSVECSVATICGSGNTLTPSVAPRSRHALCAGVLQVTAAAEARTTSAAREIFWESPATRPQAVPQVQVRTFRNT
jgi:hypothetical protein